MLYEMLVNTFDSNGAIKKSSKALDIDYIDTMVHGFFASPEYYVNTTTGQIVKEKPADTTGYRHIEAVEAGKCLASYILGGNAALIGNPKYNANSTNYTAKKYHEFSNNMPRVGKVSWKVTKGAGTEYQYKKDFNVPKTPEWAEKITGVPAAKIRELANMYTDPEQHPIFNEWAGGTQKQLNGSIQLWAITALMAITKTFGLSGETFSGAWATTNSRGPVADTDTNNYLDFSSITVGNAGTTANSSNDYTGEVSISDRTVNSISCKEWFNGIKIAFKDYLTPERGYTGENIPDWDMSKRYYSNDGGVKSLVMFERDTTNKDQLQTEVINGKTYYTSLPTASS